MYKMYMHCYYIYWYIYLLLLTFFSNFNYLKKKKKIWLIAVTRITLYIYYRYTLIYIYTLILLLFNKQTNKQTEFRFVWKKPRLRRMKRELRRKSYCWPVRVIHLPPLNENEFCFPPTVSEQHHRNSICLSLSTSILLPSPLR